MRSIRARSRCGVGAQVDALEHERAQRSHRARRPPSPCTMSPASAECSTQVAHERVDPLRAGRSRARRSPRPGRSPAREHPGAQRVVDVVVDVGDPVDHPHDPALQRRGGGARPGVARMPSRTWLGEVEPGAVALEPLDHPQRVLVVAEAACRSARAGTSSSTSSPMCPNGGWPRSWPEADRLGQVLVEAQRARDGARDPRDLERVGQPRAVVVALGRDEDLRLVLEPPERLRVHDPVAVALERRAQRRVGLVHGALGRIGARRPAATATRPRGGERAGIGVGERGGHVRIVAAGDRCVSAVECSAGSRARLAVPPADRRLRAPPRARSARGTASSDT